MTERKQVAVIILGLVYVLGLLVASSWFAAFQNYKASMIVAGLALSFMFGAKVMAIGSKKIDTPRPAKRII